MRIRSATVSAAAFVFCAVTAPASESAGNGSVIDAMREEVDRQFAVFSRLDDHPVYYLGYQVVETRSFEVSAAWGGIVRSRTRTRRVMDLDLRVGSPALDNTHKAERSYSDARPVTLDGDVRALKADMWLKAEESYRSAVEKYVKVVTDRAVNVEEEDPSPDFCSAPKVRLLEEPAPLPVDEAEWEGVVRRVSATMRKYPELLECGVDVGVEGQVKYFANSEGSDIVQFEPRAEVRILAQSRASDGMNFWLYRDFPARSVADLPAETELVRAADEIGETLSALTRAPMVDPFVGPAILGGRAAAVLFHEVLGHRLEGHRQKDEDASQTFTKRINTRILPEFISIYSDPTLETIEGRPLTGNYRFDDEGVAATRVTLVDRGVLRAFMMSRSPVRGFPVSNGHGRKEPGQSVVSRQSNLIIEASNRVPVAELRRRLIAMCRKEGKPYGLMFEDIEGGFTFTGRTVPNAFNVMPLVVRRIYTDGRPDEIVRGVDLIGTPLSMLDRIVGAGTDIGVFNGYCGAESGSVPVGASSPSLLVSEVEVQRKYKATERKPLLPAPSWREVSR